MDLDAVADELYGLSLDDFIATRTAREREAKGAGNKELAEEIHRLPKPNAVAWLVNQLVRQHPGDIQNLLELGAGMRGATASLSGDLRELSRQQHRVIRALVQLTEGSATAAGRPVSPTTTRSLEETLYAALADPGAADAVAAGRLAAGLSPAGFAGLETIGGPKAPAVTKPRSGPEERPATKGSRGAKQHERTIAKVARAKSLAEEAAEARDDARATLGQTDEAVVDARHRVEQLRRELLAAEKAESEAETHRRRAQTTFERADRRAEDAEHRLTDAITEQERVD